MLDAWGDESFLPHGLVSETDPEALAAPAIYTDSQYNCWNDVNHPVDHPSPSGSGASPGGRWRRSQPGAWPKWRAKALLKWFTWE